MRHMEPVSRVMTKGVETVQVGQPMSAARKLLSDRPFHHLPVMDGEKPVGMVSNSDIMRLVFNAGNIDAREMDAFLDHTFTLEDAMTRDLVSVQQKDHVRDAAAALATGDRHAVLVLDGEQLAGIVTSTDLIQFLLEQY